MNRPCLPGAFSFYHTIKLNAKESNVVKEKLKYPIPRLPPLCKHLLDDFGNVTAGKKAEPWKTAPLKYRKGKTHASESQRGDKGRHEDIIGDTTYGLSERGAYKYYSIQRPVDIGTLGSTSGQFGPK